MASTYSEGAFFILERDTFYWLPGFKHLLFLFQNKKLQKYQSKVK